MKAPPHEVPAKTPEGGTPPFLTPDQVATRLNVDTKTVFELIQRSELRALLIVAAPQWRVGVADLEAYIAQAYKTAKAIVQVLDPIQKNKK